MEFKIRGMEKIKQLMDKGVLIPNSYSLDIGEEVDPARIAGERVTLFPGCRIYGKETVISSGVQLGGEGPVTLENCRLGPEVELKAGYFKGAVFLDKAGMGAGAHVREGCILEEEAGGAHCVGLKQTILFPFVTLGSLINFCDCLMAGGTSRKNHSEVGSSYIHFNFTPEGHKATPSLIGDVPRGVMLNQPPVFLGGQGGMVGPLRLGFGNVVAAGTILRKDVLENNKLIIGNAEQERVIDYRPGLFPNLTHLLENNLFYLGQIAALEQWYRHVRRLFFERREYGLFLYEGALHNLALAKQERLKRLQALANQVSSRKTGDHQVRSDKQRLCDQIAGLQAVFNQEIHTEEIQTFRDSFLQALAPHVPKGAYVASIRGLPPETARQGVQWLHAVVDESCRRSAGLFPDMPLFKKSSLSIVKRRR